MNLPELNQLRETESTYITFSKSLLDFDLAIANGTACYFNKMVALNLPVWENPDFFMDLSGANILSTNPNLVFPKAIQYYMENIIRQSIGINDVEIDEITELAFWKLLNKMGMTDTDIANSVTFINSIVTSNFVKTENNNGWGEIICQIPNKCNLLNNEWRTVANIKDIVQANDDDVCLFDNNYKQFLFDLLTLKRVIDFDNVTFDEVTEQNFDFNTLLLFYTDSTGKTKLHGINFIYPFENKVSYWDLTTFTQKTNIDRTLGYQFKFMQKTCNNDATRLAVYNQNDPAFWNIFSETLSGLNSFLEIKMRESSQIQ